jgi:Carbohydrate family 9 binding domain-like
MTSRSYCERRLLLLSVLVTLPLLLVLIVFTAKAQSPAGSQRGPLPPATEIMDLEDSVIIDKRKPLTLSRLHQTPVIDGRLNEPVWHTAALLKDFLQTQPGDNVKVSYPTEVRIGYDSKSLYIAIHALDQSGQVRATVAKRDDLSGNDYVAVWLDTFNDQRRAYVLLFNPLGVQADGIFTEGQAIDYSVDLVMQSKGTITADGYTIEVAIPFASLRYDAGAGKFWGVHVLRVIRHLDEWDTWMPLRRESRDFNTATFIRFMEQAGHIGGIENIGRERTLELIPTLTLSETGHRVPLDSQFQSPFSRCYWS